jgi:hypothetical protein
MVEEEVMVEAVSCRELALHPTRRLWPLTRGKCLL